MHVKAAIALTQSVRHVFTTMLGAAVEVGKPTRVTGRPGGHDVSAVIGLHGAVAGSVAICLCADTANALARTFAGFEQDPAEEDLADAIGELANMITGNAKARLNTDGVSITVPSVILGNAHTVARHRGVPVVELPCTCAMGAFSILLAIRPAPVGAAAN